MKSAELSSSTSSVVFQEGTGKYTLKVNSFELKDCQPVLELDGKNTSFGKWKILKQTASSVTAEAIGKSGVWTLIFRMKKNGAVTVSMKGKLTEPHISIKARYFSGLSLKADHVLTQNNTMGGCLAVPLKSKPQDSELQSAIQLIVTRKGEQFMMSYPLVTQHVADFTCKGEKGAVNDLSTGIAIRHFSSKKIDVPPLIFRAGDGFQMMYEYADENVTEEKNFDDIAVPGWNSWDYYRWTITEKEVLENAEFIAADPVLSKYVKRIIIDDGWQYAYGEWEANSYFPHGMKWLAGEIKKLGFQPGIWIAPTLIEPHSWIAQMEPDMLAKAESGLPTLCFECMKRNTFILDPTVEKSQKFITDLFSRYADYGYEYFKLDFLGATCRARQFTDKTIGRGQLMDYTIGLARKATAGRAKILGCNYMYSGGMPYVDAVRVGGDIHARWDSIKANTPSIAARFWANKKLWVNDPDFALCRAYDTSDDPMLNQMRCSTVFIPPESTDPHHPGWEFTLVDMYKKQAEVLLSLVISGGGACNLSDKMTRLNAIGLDLARRTVSAESGEAAVPLDLFSTELPSYWVQRVRDYHRVLLINWSDNKAAAGIDLRKLGIDAHSAVNFWNDEPVQIKNGKIETELDGRSCLFAVVR